MTDRGVEDPAPQRAIPWGLLALCAALWLVGLAFGLYAAWIILTFPKDLSLGLVALLVGGISAAAGWGLFRLRRWGVILFGALSLAGSVNHLANVILRFPDLSRTDAPTAAAAVLSVLGGFLIPFALLYLTLMLWKRVR